RRSVVDHEYRLDRHAGVLVTKLDERIDIAEAHVVGAGGNTRNRLEGTGRAVDGDVEPLRLVVALVDPDQKWRRRTLELEIEAELDRRLGCGAVDGCRYTDADKCTGYLRAT